MDTNTIITALLSHLVETTIERDTARAQLAKALQELAAAQDATKE